MRVASGKGYHNQYPPQELRVWTPDKEIPKSNSKNKHGGYHAESPYIP